MPKNFHFPNLIICSIILFSIISTNNCQVTSFKFDLLPQEHQCFMEYFPDKTLVIYEISSNTSEIDITIKAPDKSAVRDQKTNKGSNILAKETTKSFKLPFTTYIGGYYEICLSNPNRKEANLVSFNFKHGVTAKDYSSVAKSNELKPIELELEKLIDRSTHMSHYAYYAQSHEQMFEKSLDGISSKIVFFSIILISIMVFIGVVETLYLKKFMQKRKII